MWTRWSLILAHGRLVLIHRRLVLKGRGLILAMWRLILAMMRLILTMWSLILGTKKAGCGSWDLCSTMCLRISLMWGWGRRSVELIVLLLGWVLTTTGSLEPVLLRF